MIRLAIQDYCQDCPAFDPTAVKNIVEDEDGDEKEITEVRCSRWMFCANVVRRAAHSEATLKMLKAQ